MSMDREEGGERKRALLSSLRPQLSPLKAAILVSKVAVISGRDVYVPLQKLPTLSTLSRVVSERRGRSLPCGRRSTDAPHRV